MKKISCVVGLLLWAGGVWGYQFQVSPVVLQGPLTEDQHRLDMNGTECGVLLVTTPIENIDFKMSVIGGCGVEKPPPGTPCFWGKTRVMLRSARPILNLYAGSLIYLPAACRKKRTRLNCSLLERTQHRSPFQPIY